MKKTIIAVAVLITVHATAQTIPAVVKNSFATNFQGVSVKKWDKENGKYEANFTKEGKMVSATFDANGTLEETEWDIKVSELPSSVTDYLKANYKGLVIKEAAIITKPNGDKLYEAEVKGKDVLFDRNGKFLKEQKD